MKSKKHIAEQFNFVFVERALQILDNVMVSPDETAQLNQVKPVTKIFSGQIVQMTQSFLIVKDNTDGQLYPVYHRQCKLIA